MKRTATTKKQSAEFWEDGSGVRYWEVPRLARDMDWDKLIRRVTEGAKTK